RRLSDATHALQSLSLAQSPEPVRRGLSRARAAGRRRTRRRGRLAASDCGMRIALFADVHANFPALEACIAHARAEGAQRLVFLGDLVGYGADAQAVVAAVATEVERGAVAIKGNHDEAV